MAITAKTQNSESKLDLRFGIGRALLGTGDMRAIMFENELNLNLNEYFVLGGGLGFGKSDYGVFDQASFIQVNTNIYYSPFRNNRKNDFRIGTGLSWYSVSDVNIISFYINGQRYDSDVELDSRNSIGYNVILENTYSITEKMMLGLKVFFQAYQSSDVNSGVLLKIGVRI